ncbi:MAG: CO dehydrogenase nickel-insertion accessory protein CooC1 [Candidatus Alkanophagales archaeon MCA70_species_1]|nr:CO dehydrogenase nickel-insertion accessory protein CooC1 [Candidatus Alkanophaga volatiphilum]
MTTVISVTGKGGVGKTTVAALLVLKLVRRGRRPVLAVDADPNSNLCEALGERFERTVGDVREAFERERDRMPPTVDKKLQLEYKLMGVLCESRGFDVLVMGRPEGPGCYCAVNHLLREVLDRIVGGYRFVVVDCEAGLEHFSRRTVRDVDKLLVVVDATKKALSTARRIKELAGLVRVKRQYLVLNMVRSEKEERVLRRGAAELGLEVAGVMPYDENVLQLDIEGRPLTELPEDSPFSHAIDELMGFLAL